MGGGETSGLDQGPLPPSDDPPPVAADDGDGALLDSDALVRRLGGWQVMASLGDLPLAAGDDVIQRHRSSVARPSSTAPAASGAMPLRWTVAAAAECQRLHTIVGSVGEDAATRFAAAVMRLIVHLTVDGVAARQGEVVEVALLPSLALRIRVAGGSLVVIGLCALPSIS